MANAHPTFHRRHVLEFEASALFHTDDARSTANLSWCANSATFAHQLACEYLIYLPSARRDRRDQLRDMREAGVSHEFLEVVKAAHERRADLLLLYV